IQNPYPQGFLIPGTFRSPISNIGAQIQAPLYPLHQGNAQVFSFSLQRQVLKDLAISANYWGNKGTHLYAGTWELNQLPDQYLSLGQKLNNLVPNPFYGVIQTGALSGTQISQKQALLPFPQYTSVQDPLMMAASSTYNAFSLSADKRMSKGLMFQ